MNKKIYFASIVKEFSKIRASRIYILGEDNNLIETDIGHLKDIDGYIFFHDSPLLIDEFIGSNIQFPSNIADIGLLINTIEVKESKEASERSKDIVRLFGTLPSEGEMQVSKYLKAFWGRPGS